MQHVLTQHTTVADIDWQAWQPQQRATLLFVVRDGKVLLIHKKRGLGAGKINGPGGRIEPGESARDGAVREVEEELCTTPLEVRKSGELSFQFIDGLSLHVQVFKAAACTTEPRETDEAIPRWAPVTRIPYPRMWQDDIHWLPLMLADRPFSGYFVFDNDTLLSYRMDESPIGTPS